jgi:hypothetical protein
LQNTPGTIRQNFPKIREYTRLKADIAGNSLEARILFEYVNGVAILRVTPIGNALQD